MNSSFGVISLLERYESKVYNAKKAVVHGRRHVFISSIEGTFKRSVKHLPHSRET